LACKHKMHKVWLGLQTQNAQSVLGGSLGCPQYLQ